MSIYRPDRDAAYFNGRSPGHLPGLIGVSILDAGQGFMHAELAVRRELFAPNGERRRRADDRVVEPPDFGPRWIGHSGFFPPHNGDTPRPLAGDGLDLQLFKGISP